MPASPSSCPITVRAGLSAYRRIQAEGLSPDMISAVFGASGAAKWLAITGLDQAIFADWLPQRQANHPITLFGTSVGAFKLAAAAHHHPRQAMDRLALAYIAQNYDTEPTQKITAEKVSQETDRILTELLGADHAGAYEILSNPDYRFACGAIRCHGSLNRSSSAAQKWAMLSGFFKTLFGSHNKDYERAIFADPRLGAERFVAQDHYPIRLTPLTPASLPQALLASGSIPVYMQGVRFANDPEHLYRDGGLLDYHPVPQNLLRPARELVLYPHFYPYIVEKWFEKYVAWRRCPAHKLDQVVLISPSPTHVQALPYGRIPDRQDFRRFAHNDNARILRWQHAVTASQELGAAFLDLCKSGEIAAITRPL